jgi:hypothetical protein
MAAASVAVTLALTRGLRPTATPDANQALPTLAGQSLQQSP